VYLRYTRPLGDLNLKVVTNRYSEVAQNWVRPSR
jgi:hypothetical protein